MKNTSFKQAILLNIFGIFLTVILLELGLRMAGFAVFYLQERHNHASFQGNEFRILCLGESTTALGGEDSYPSQLELMLNSQQAQKKFAVINKGIISTTSNTILSNLDHQLDLYKPQLVIVMMGINDRAYLRDLRKVLWWENIKFFVKDLKVYKLSQLLYKHIINRMKEINATSSKNEPSTEEETDPQQVDNFFKALIENRIQDFSAHLAKVKQFQENHQIPEANLEQGLAQKAIDQAALASVELARRLRLQGHLDAAQQVLTQTNQLNPNFAENYQEWGEYYLAVNQTAQAIKAFESAIQLDPKNPDFLLGLAHALHQAHNDKAYFAYADYLQYNPKNYWGYIELAQWLKEAKKYDLALGYLTQAMDHEPLFNQAYIDIAQLLDEQGQFPQEEGFYLKELSLHPDNLRLNQGLGHFYQNHGRQDLAKKYLQQALQFEMKEYCPATLVNYKLLLNKVLKRHIQLIVMQYPIRDIDILKDYLGDQQGVYYVENKQNFKNALLNGGYNRYFKDNFAWDFGHCSRAGNELIARNLTDNIINKILNAS